MTDQKLAEELINSLGGIAKTADFLAAGLAKSAVYELLSKGFLQRIRHGYYQLAECSEISEAQYLASLLPEGIICMESALFYYGYSNFTPRVWTVAVPRAISQAKLKLEIIPIRPYYIQPEFYEIGRTTAIFSEVTLPIYDRERTICDCFKYRTKLDRELFVEAIHFYVKDNQKNLANLSRYAKKMGLWTKVNDLMEVVLNV